VNTEPVEDEDARPTFDRGSDQNVNFIDNCTDLGLLENA
jgi:hypothetical protein